jgi:pimeloyl-ACP methyl ester carboxylesterase
VLTIATPPVAGTPAVYDKVQVRRFGNPSAPHVLVLVPGTNGGAGDFDLVAPYLATHVPDLQVWSEMRREGALQDESVVQSTLAGRTTSQQMFDYYLGWISDHTVTTHYQPLKPADYGFVADWGMAVAMNDLHAVILEAGAGGTRTVTLGGHSLGGTEAAAYATWDFGGHAGYTTINGIVCIDGCAGAQGFYGPTPTIPSVQASIAQLSTKGPWLDLLGIGLPWATGAFSEVGAVTAYEDPTGPATSFENFPLLPAEFKPPKPVTNQAQFGYAFDYRTSPPGLKLIQVHSGSVATTGDPAGWVDTDITPIANVVDAFAQTPLAAAEWYYPERLSIDAAASASLQQTDVATSLGLRLLHTSQVDVPLYAFQTALGGQDNAVAASAQAFKAESKIPSVTVVSRTATYSHLDPLLASPARNDFLATVVPWLKRVDR